MNGMEILNADVTFCLDCCAAKLYDDKYVHYSWTYKIL